MNKIYKIRNVGNKHANFEAVTSTEALSLDIRKPKLEEFLAGLEVEDMHIPGHANTQTTRRFQLELPEIISGKSQRWHLWEVLVYRRSLVLHYADKQSGSKNCRATALKCFTEWPENLQLEIQTPNADCSCYSSCCKISYELPKRRTSLLTVEYTNVATGTFNRDFYETRLRG